MSDLTIARRYAQALFELARERNLLETVQDDLARVMRGVQESGELKRMLADQLVPAAEKKSVFRKVFGPVVAKETMNFLLLVLDKRRERFLEDMHREFLAFVNDARNIVEAEVRSAVPLSAGELQALQGRLAQASGKEVRLSNRVDPALVGGLVVKIGDRIYDGSVKRRLGDLRQRLRQADFREIGVR